MIQPIKDSIGRNPYQLAGQKISSTSLERLVRTPIHIAAESHVLPISRVARLAIPLKQKVDDVASDIERFVLKVVSSPGLEVGVGRITPGETIALASSNVSQKLAFSTRLCVGYPDEFGAGLNANSRARADHESYCKQASDLHLDVLDSPFEIAGKRSKIKPNHQRILSSIDITAESTCIPER